MKYRYTLLCFILGIMTVKGQKVNYSEPIKLTFQNNASSENAYPLLSADGQTLFFVKSFDKRNKGGLRAGQDIWFVERIDSTRWSEEKNLKALNNKYNNAVIGVGADNPQQLYLLNTYSPSDKQNYSIAKSTLGEGSIWTAPVEMKVELMNGGNFKAFYLTPDETVLLLSTQGEDTYGEEDLYLYHKEKGEWKGPLHLDEKINSSGSEISPFITHDLRALIFSSNGHEGLGDFDLYISERLDDSWENWSVPQNLGVGINSPHFDAYLSTYENGETFFVSNKEGKSANIYTTNMQILYMYTGPSLSINQSAFTHGEFKKTLLLDLNLTKEIIRVLETTSELSKGTNEVMKWNRSMDIRLLGLDERDSLINHNVHEQLMLDDTTSPFKELRRDNQALSEDLNAIVKRNITVEKYINTLAEHIPGPATYTRKEDRLLIQLKQEIAQQVAEIASIKQEISGYLDANAWKKNVFALIANKRGQESSMRQIMTANQKMDTLIARWLTRLELLKEKTSALINETSVYQVYLSEKASELLSSDELTEKIEQLFSRDAAVNERLSRLASEMPNRSRDNVEVWIRKNSAITQNLVAIKRNDRLISKNIRELFRKDRNSDTFKHVVLQNDPILTELSKPVAKVRSEDFTFPPDEILNEPERIAKKQQLPEHIIKNIDRKQNIYELVARNMLLKEHLIQPSLSQESTIEEINENRKILESEIKEYANSVDALRKSILAIEREFSPVDYIANVLSTNSRLNDEFLKTLEEENAINKGLSSNLSEVDPQLVINLKNYISEISTHNRKLATIGSLQRSLDNSLDTLLNRDLSSAARSGLLARAEVYDQETQVQVQNYTANNSASLNQNFEVSESPVAIVSEFNRILYFSSKGNSIKRLLVGYKAKNSKLKQKVLQKKGIDPRTVGDIDLNNVQIQELTVKWSEYLQHLWTAAIKVQKAIENRSRLKELLSRSIDLSEKYEEMVKNDTIAVMVNEFFRSQQIIFENQNPDSSLVVISDMLEGLSQDLSKESFLYATRDIDQLKNNLDIYKQQLNEWEALLDRIWIYVAQPRSPTTISGYTVQIIAISNNGEPNPHFFDKLNRRNITKDVGKDGFNRFYVGAHNSINEALRALAKLRSLGYYDAFVRALSKYDEL